MFGSVLPKNAQTALAELGYSNLLQNAYLAGGTALALHLGHRQSVDFDFFSAKSFDPVELGASLSQLGQFRMDVAKGITLIGEFKGVKFSYFQYNYPLLQLPTEYNGVKIAHVHDIAAMKLAAISDRSTKKDYIDLFEIAKRGIPLELMFTFYEQKYHLFEANLFTLLKSLTFFEDAEIEVMPVMLIPCSWEKVKEFFISESMRLGKKYLEPKE